MSNVVAVQNQPVAQNWTPEQLKLITDVVAKGATQDELKIFLYRCQNMGLDPLKPGMVHFIKYGNSPGTIVVGIEGFRSIAARTGKISGIKRGVIKEDGKLVAGYCEVYRSDWQHPAREEVPFAEYNTGKGPWSKMPETMIKKVAEAAALRMAFPDHLGGVYTKEEMDQADNDPTPPSGGANGYIKPEEPGALDGNPSHDVGYRIPFGKFAKRALEEIDPKELGNYVMYLERKADTSGEPLRGAVADFVHRAAAYIAAMENGTLEEEGQF